MLMTPQNPFRPGAGQRPLYLAGRTDEKDRFANLLRQRPVAQNVIVTGLRGVGKTVLLETLKPIAQASHWLWTGNDLSESASLTEERIARRIVVDLSTLLGPIVVQTSQILPLGFRATEETAERPLSFDDLWRLFETTPGLVEDKLKAVLQYVGRLLQDSPITGVIFAYDEAQNLSDHAAKDEYPLSLLLDSFSFLQRQNTRCQFLLVLAGLPTLYPKLNEARTYTERMFHVMQIGRLDDEFAREAITKPIEITKSSLRFSDSATEQIIALSGGYPYFIQFVCKEMFDAWIGRMQTGLAPSVPQREILEKLDQDFFAPRWARATDRQQEFMQVIAGLENCEDEFSVHEIVTATRQKLEKPFTPSHANQMLTALAERGLIYRSRRGGYCFAVPLLARFIKRQGLRQRA